MLSLLLPQFLLSTIRGARAQRQVAQPAQVAQTLMESAGSRSGLNPHQAAELRGAALAFLRVMR